MKSLITGILLSLSAPILASSQPDFKTLCQLSPICDVYNTAQTQVDAIFFEMMSLEGLEPDEVEDYYLPGRSELPYIGESFWGQLSFDQVVAFVQGHADEEFYGDVLGPGLVNQILNILKTNHSEQVIYGYAPFGGGSACGLSWPSLLIILPEQGKYFQIGFFGRQPC